jgi:hypothetical protein
MLIRMLSSSHLHSLIHKCYIDTLIRWYIDAWIIL